MAGDEPGLRKNGGASLVTAIGGEQICEEELAGLFLNIGWQKK